jgi:hypothetical protein
MGIKYADHPKQLGESLIYSMEFVPGAAIATGDTLTGTPTVAVKRVSDGVSVPGMLSGSASRNGNIISAKIIGGTDGESYKITFSCATTNGEIVEEDLVVEVIEL